MANDDDNDDGNGNDDIGVPHKRTKRKIIGVRISKRLDAQLWSLQHPSDGPPKSASAVIHAVLYDYIRKHG